MGWIVPFASLRPVRDAPRRFPDDSRRPDEGGETGPVAEPPAPVVHLLLEASTLTFGPRSLS